MTEKWVPQVGDHVFSIHEFIVDDTERDRKIPGYNRHGYEIVESVVKCPYRWRRCDGVESVVERRRFGDNANNCLYWKANEYGKRLFRTREEAVPLADSLTDYYEEHYRFGEKEPCFRHWKEE